MDSTSPLLAFSYSYGGCEISDPECPIEEVEEGGVPLRDGVPSRYSLNGARKNVTVQVIAFSRGGPMHDVARRPAGSLRTTSGGTGGFHRFNLGFRFRAQTCAVTPQNVDLDPVDAVTLQRNGSAGEKSFNVRVSCAASGRRLVLELVDVHDPASTSNTLKAAPGSTANGVAVQILSGGNPVRMKAPGPMAPHQAVPCRFHSVRATCARPGRCAPDRYVVKQRCWQITTEVRRA